MPSLNERNIFISTTGGVCAAEASTGEQQPPGAETQVQHFVSVLHPRTLLGVVFVKDLFLDRLQVTPGNLTPVKTVGPLTDVDVIKLRPCERKQVSLSRSLFFKTVFSVGCSYTKLLVTYNMESASFTPGK